MDEQPDLFGGAVLTIFDKAPREYIVFLGMPLTETWSFSGSGSSNFPAARKQSWQWNLVPSFD